MKTEDILFYQSQTSSKVMFWDLSKRKKSKSQLRSDLFPKVNLRNWLMNFFFLLFFQSERGVNKQLLLLLVLSHCWESMGLWGVNFILTIFIYYYMYCDGKSLFMLICTPSTFPTFNLSQIHLIGVPLSCQLLPLLASCDFSFTSGIDCSSSSSATSI